MLTAVGFSSPPAWVKPYHVLSTGERFRCDLARALLSPRRRVVFDEFTSVVDRTVARIGSAAVAKAVRRLPSKQFVAVTCHYDVARWLQPDWVLDMGLYPAHGVCRIHWRRLRRPRLRLRIYRATPDAWPPFARHHYLSSELNRAAHCYVGVVDQCIRHAPRAEREAAHGVCQIHSRRLLRHPQLDRLPRHLAGLAVGRAAQLSGRRHRPGDAPGGGQLLSAVADHDRASGHAPRLGRRPRVAAGRPPPRRLLSPAPRPRTRPVRRRRDCRKLGGKMRGNV